VFKVIVEVIGSALGPHYVSFGDVFERMVEMVGSAVRLPYVSFGGGAFERMSEMVGSAVGLLYVSVGGGGAFEMMVGIVRGAMKCCPASLLFRRTRTPNPLVRKRKVK
jgi:hypothetical protein